MDVLKPIIQHLINFRNKLYTLIPKRRDAVFEVIDAISTNTQADSVVKLSLNPHCRRTYNSIHDAVENFFLCDESDEKSVQANQARRQSLEQLILEQIPQAGARRPYNLFGTDCTSNPRPFATKVEDTKVVYQPNPVLKNKPITVGHEFSLLAYLPEKTENNHSHWILPITFERVKSTEKGEEIGVKQFIRCTPQDPKNPDQLNVLVGDGK